MRVAAMGPVKGMSEMLSAADAAVTDHCLEGHLHVEGERCCDDLHFVAEVVGE